MPLKLSIVVCSLGRPESVEQCLEALVRQTIPLSDLEVILVGDDLVLNRIKHNLVQSTRLNTEVWADPNKGLAAARDLGWRQARGEFVAWIDDDTVVAPDWAASVIEFLERNPEIGGVSGPTIVPSELLQKRDVFFFYGRSGWLGWLGKFWNWFFLEGKMFEPGLILKSGAWSPGSNFPSAMQIRGLKEVDYLEACNMTFRKNLVEEVGGFDLGFQGTAEWCEIDLAQKIKKLGYKLVFSSQIKVDHRLSRVGVFSKRTHAKERMENFLRFYFRHIFKPRLDYLFRFSAYLLFLNFYWLTKVIQTRNPDWMGGWWGTLVGLKQYVFGFRYHRQF